jgi:hypothetical protein
VKASTVVLAIVLALCGVASVVAIIAGLIYFGGRGISSRPATDAERRLILSATSFEKFGETLEPKCQKYTSRVNLDGTREVELEYDCGESSAVFITSEAEICRSVREARESFALSIGAYKAGLTIGGGTVEARPELLSLGDQHYAALVRSGTNVVGCVFVVRQGRVVHALVTTGIYFDDPDDIRDLFAPLLEESKKQYGN